jgi:hypothetical protein
VVDDRGRQAAGERMQEVLHRVRPIYQPQRWRGTSGRDPF